MNSVPNPVRPTTLFKVQFNIIFQTTRTHSYTNGFFLTDLPVQNLRTFLISPYMLVFPNNPEWLIKYKGADKSLARPGRKQATATEDFEFHISYL